MSIEANNVKVTIISPEETERILAEKYGGKLSPVNKTKLAQQRQKQEAFRSKNSLRKK